MASLAVQADVGAVQMTETVFSCPDHWLACELRNTPLPQNFDFNYATTNIGTGLLGPKYENEGGLAPMPPHQPAITAQDIIDVQNGRKFLYLMGWTRYFDVFPKTPEHITRFCWIVIPNGNPLAFIPNSPEGSGHTLTFGYLHFPRGNLIAQTKNATTNAAPACRSQR
jgi:hypothetical protein